MKPFKDQIRQHIVSKFTAECASIRVTATNAAIMYKSASELRIPPSEWKSIVLFGFLVGILPRDHTIAVNAERSVQELDGLAQKYSSATVHQMILKVSNRRSLLNSAKTISELLKPVGEQAEFGPRGDRGSVKV